MFASMEEILSDLKAGKIVIVLDDASRENEGDFVAAAERITPATINFMITHGRGLVCLALAPSHVQRLQLQPQTTRGTSKFQTPFLVSIEAAKGVTTGISAFDRAHTIQVAVNHDSTPDDLATPGHIFPLAAHKEGVFGRRGHTEGSVDLMRLAGLDPSAVICEILKEDGSMARRDDLILLARRYGLKMTTIEDIITYRTTRTTKQ